MPAPDEEFLRLLIAAEGDLRAFIGSVVNDRQTRDDVYQDVAVVLWRKFDSYDRERPFGAWARGVATLTIKQRQRADARFPIAYEPAAIDAIREAFDRAAPACGHQADALRICLRKIPSKSRRMLALRYEEGLSCEAVAGRMGRGVDAIYQALSRLRKQLEACVTARLGKGGTQ